MIIQRTVSFFIVPLLIIGIWGFFFNFNPATETSIIQPDSSLKAFNSSDDPIWLAHLTDVHVAPHFPNSENRLEKYLQYFENILKPSFAVISGDIADNYGSEKAPVVSEPFEEHWIGYERAVNNSGINKDRLFEVFGNHDLWGIAEFDEISSYAARYTSTTRDSFYSYSYERDGVRMVGFVPQDFPTGHGPLGFCPPMKRKMLDKLEEVLARPTQAQITVVSMHFTTELIFPLFTKSSKGNDFFGILNNPSYNVFALLNGHTHPRNVEYLHIGQRVIEITGTALKEKDAFGVLAIDNGRLSYRSIVGCDSDLAILTCPAPNEQSTRVFNDNSFEIRVLSFSANLSRNFLVSGAVVGILNNTREIKPGVIMYSMNVTLPDGIHRVLITGDLYQEVEFSIRTSIGPYMQPRSVDIIHWSVILGLVMIVLYHVIVFMFSLFESSKFDAIADWLKEKSSEGHIVKSIVYGPCVTGRIIRDSPRWQKNSLYIILGWPLVLPCFLYSTSGKVSFLFLYGYMVNWKFMYDIFAQLIGSVYYMTIALIFSFMIYRLRFPVDKWIWIDFCIIFSLYASCYYFWYNYGADIGSPYYWLFSFQYAVIPLISLVIFIAQIAYSSTSIQIAGEHESDSCSTP